MYLQHPRGPGETVARAVAAPADGGGPASGGTGGPPAPTAQPRHRPRERPSPGWSRPSGPHGPVPVLPFLLSGSTDTKHFVSLYL